MPEAPTAPGRRGSWARVSSTCGGWSVGWQVLQLAAQELGVGGEATEHKLGERVTWGLPRVRPAPDPGRRGREQQGLLGTAPSEAASPRAFLLLTPRHPASGAVWDAIRGEALSVRRWGSGAVEAGSLPVADKLLPAGRCSLCLALLGCPDAEALAWRRPRLRERQVLPGARRTRRLAQLDPPRPLLRSWIPEGHLSGALSWPGVPGL